MLNKYLDKLIDEFMDANNNEVSINEAASYFYELGKQAMNAQMLKDAVEGFIFQSADYYPKQLIAGYDGELGMGDKVKIVIVKEDKK